MGKLTDEVNRTEEAYTQSLEDIATQKKNEYEENKDYSTFSNQADELAREQRQNETDLNVATGLRQTNLSYQPKKQVDIENAYNKKKLTDATKMAYLQYASEEAKMKYNLAAQKKAQAQANWNNAGKVLQSLGCALSLIPGIGWAIGGGVSAAGAVVGAIGSASV